MTGGVVQQAAHGFLNINKEVGETSTGVVRAVKRITGCRKVGHGGTLDPSASGVLPVCLGQATRFADAALHGNKAYAMIVRLGAATDTYDVEGTPTLECDPSSIAREDVARVLDRFRGCFEQVPPMYSAIKQGGKRLYQLARAGIEVDRPPRPVEVRSLELADWAPPEFRLEVECGSGFYARSLAHDIGVALGNAAHLAALVRRHSGPFALADSVTLGFLEEAATRDEWRSLLFPIDTGLQDLPALVLDPLQTEQVRHGQWLTVSSPAGSAATGQGEQRARAYTRSGELVAVLVRDPQNSLWRPSKVIAISQGRE